MGCTDDTQKQQQSPATAAAVAVAFCSLCCSLALRKKHQTQIWIVYIEVLSAVRLVEDVLGAIRSAAEHHNPGLLGQRAAQVATKAILNSIDIESCWPVRITVCHARLVHNCHAAELGPLLPAKHNIFCVSPPIHHTTSKGVTPGRCPAPMRCRTSANDSSATLLKLAVVIPTLNEEHNIQAVVER